VHVKIVDSAKAVARSAYAAWLAAGAGIIVVLAVAYWFGWLGTLARSSVLWVLLSILAGAVIFAALRWGVPWLQEWRFLRQEGSEYVAAGEESPEEFRAKFAKALQMLQGLPQLKGKADPLHALPWYLLIGDGQSGKTTAVRASDLFSPLFPPSATGAGTQNYDWWVSNSAVILDTAGRYAMPVDVGRDRAEWYRLLRLLHHRRAYEPINGLVIVVAADWLASQTDERLRADASKLRDRIEEAVRELGADFPVYLLVTKCDVIQGFAEFFGQLPERMRDEVLGYVDDPTTMPHDGRQSGRGAAALGRLEAGLNAICDRLRFLRLPILDSKAPAELHQAVFCLPEEFRALRRPLLSFAEPLLSEDVRYHTPLFRGVFFSSAQQTATRISLLRRELSLGEETVPGPAGSQPFFLSDLFDGILPRDRGMVAATPREHRRRGLRQLLRTGAGAGAVLVMTALVVRAFTIDGRITASVDPSVCPEAAPKASARPRFEVVERCRQGVQSLTNQNQRRPHWSTWLFNRSGHLEQRLRERYVRAFRGDVLVPLDSEIERVFQTSTDPLPLMLMVARRIHLERRCLSPGGCPPPVAEEIGPDYAVMLNPGRGPAAPSQQPADLRESYIAYVIWQSAPREALSQDLAEDQKRLQRWLSAKQFEPDQLVQWVNKRSPPLTYENYWELPAPIATVAAPRIEAACTRKVWEQDIAPFLQQIQDAVPDVAQRLREFDERYIGNCFTQWQRFLAGFPQGANRWSGPERRRSLAQRLLTERSPYRSVIEDAFNNLAPWTPEEGTAGIAPAWARTLKRYAESEQWKLYQSSLKNIAKQLEGDSRTEASFKLAQQAFAESKPSAESSHPVLRAYTLASQASQGGGEPAKPGDDIVGPLLQEPIRLVWRVMLEDAGLYMKKNWADAAVTPLKGVAPADQVVLLYGPGGKVGSFVEQFVHPFLAPDGGTAGIVLGQGVPLSPAFLRMLDEAKRLKPLFEGGSMPQPVRIRATRHCTIEGRPTLREEQTLLSLACGAKTYLVSSRTDIAGEETVTVPWAYQSCGDVTIAIYISDSGHEPGGAVTAVVKRLQLTKRYGGQTGFLHFLKDFHDGSQRFQSDDLVGADPESWQILKSGVRAIEVYFDVETPPGLSDLVSALQEAGPPEDVVSLSTS